MKKRKNPTIKDLDALTNMVANAAASTMLTHAIRGMGPDRALFMAVLIEQFIRPFILKVRPSEAQRALERLEAERIEGEYEECR